MINQEISIHHMSQVSSPRKRFTSNKSTTGETRPPPIRSHLLVSHLQETRSEVIGHRITEISDFHTNHTKSPKPNFFEQISWRHNLSKKVRFGRKKNCKSVQTQNKCWFSRSTKCPVLLVNGFRTTKTELQMRGVFSLKTRKSACQGRSRN